jgi:hypothetical protein
VINWGIRYLAGAMTEKTCKDTIEERAGKRRWYEKYLPFIARSPRMQIDWLIGVFRKGSLSREEITPYIRLLMEEEQEDELIRSLFRNLDEWVLTELLEAADVYDIPKLFRLISGPTPDQARIALLKVPPPYEKMPGLLRGKIFHAVHDCSEELLTEAVEELRRQGKVDSDFEEAYERFREVLMDEKILSSLYPKAKL